MNTIIVKSDSNNDFFSSKKSQKRGAKVFGMPVTKEIASFIDDVAPEAAKQRFFSMFFGGNFYVLDEEDFLDEEDSMIPGAGSI